MRRREYLTAIGGTGVFVVPLGKQAATPSLEPVVPADPETHVQPGDRLLFEVEPSIHVEPQDVDWQVDGASEQELRPSAPFWSYTLITGHPTVLGEFEKTGTNEVTVSIGDASLSWEVHVTTDAPDPPQAILESDPASDSTVTTRDEIEKTATAIDDEGVLERLLWQEGRNATYFDRTEVSGRKTTNTHRTVAGDAIWLVGGYSTTVWVVCRDGRIETATADGPTIVAKRDVAITGTNAPVRSGEELLVEAEIAVDGDPTYHHLVEVEPSLIVGHDPTRVDSTAIEVMAGESERVRLGFTTATVENTQTFPVRVETQHASSETEVTVIGTGERAGRLEITGMETNAPIEGGEWFEVTATLKNTGGTKLRGDVDLVVGHDPTTVDTTRVSVGPGETTTVSLGYETYPVKADDEFPIYVRTDDDTASKSVLVYGRDGDSNADTATFDVTITGTNAPVSGGDRLTVAAEIGNVGTGGGRGTIELVVGHVPEVVDSRSVSLEPGETTGVSLGYETYPVRSDDTFPVTVRSASSSDTRTVTVHGSA